MFLTRTKEGKSFPSPSFSQNAIVEGGDECSCFVLSAHINEVKKCDRSVSAPHECSIHFLRRDASFPLHQRLHIFLPPIAHLEQDRLQAFAEVSERIFDFGGHFAVDVAINDAVFLQFAQLQREHALGNAGQQALQFAEAFFAREEME